MAGTPIANQTPAQTFSNLLLAGDNGQGIAVIPQQLQDGLGNTTLMSIGTTLINFDRAQGQFQLDGVALTATAAQLNNLTDVTGAQYVLLAADADLPASSVLNASNGIQLNLAAGSVTVSPTPGSELAGLQNLNTLDFVVRSATGTYLTRSLTSDATISITNSTGIAGNPSFSVNRDTTQQRVGVSLNTILEGTREQLNFIQGSNMGITINDNPGTNSVDIILTSQAIQQLFIKASCQAATTANLNALYNNGASGVGATLTNNGALAAFSVDGYNASLNDRILVKDMAVQAYNGIYYVSVVGSGAVAWVLTRTLDFDSSANIQSGDFTNVINGTVNANTAWLEENNVTTVGTDPIVWVKFGFGGSVTDVSGTAGQIVVVNGTTTPVISIDPTYIGQSSITTLGTITTGTWNGSLIQLAYGGTNANLTASNGGIFYSTATAGAILSGTATANQILMSGSNSAPSWSVITYPSTTLQNDMLYAIANNQLTTIGVVNSSIFTSGSGGLPGWVGPLTNGQILIGSTGLRPVASTITAGSGVTITNAPGSITIAQTANSSFQVPINQVAHGLSVGKVIRVNNTPNYVAAQADSVADSTSVVGIVVSVIDVNNFIYQFGGIITVLAGLTAGSPYFLDPVTTGNYTPVIPTTAGQVVYPLFIALSTTTALWQPKLAIELM